MSSSSVVRTWLISACLGLCACATESHSTETGNPPFIDATRVTLVMQDDGVHIKGSKGAVMSPYAEVFARNLATDDIAHKTVEFDGSFDLAVDGTLDDVYEVRVGRESNLSKPVFVTRDGGLWTYDGGAPVGDAGMLSCREREQAAADQITAVAEHADVACSADADCVRVSTGSVCHDRCGEAIVSKTGQAEIEAAQDAVADGVCKTFESDGCVLLVPPCEPEQATPACVMGKCERGPSVDNSGLSCDERLSMAGEELAQAVAGADRQCATSSDCTLAREITDCAGGCTADPVSSTGADSIAEAILAINGGVCANFEGDGCQRSAQPPCSSPIVECRGNVCQFMVTNCDQRASEARTRLDAAVSSADSSCTTDGDCVSASTSTDCFGGCGTDIVSAQGKAEIDAAIAAINSELCGNFESDGCPYSAPMCALPPGPVACIDGTCGYQQ